MDIDVAVPDGLDLLHRQEELFIQLLIQLIKNKTSLGRYKSAVRIAVLLVPDIHDRLALFINFI